MQKKPKLELPKPKRSLVEQKLKEIKSKPIKNFKRKM